MIADVATRREVPPKAAALATLRRAKRFPPFATIVKPLTARHLQGVGDRASDLA